MISPVKSIFGSYEIIFWVTASAVARRRRTVPQCAARMYTEQSYVGTSSSEPPAPRCNPHAFNCRNE